MKWTSMVFIISMLAATFAAAQNRQQGYLAKSWKQVATEMPDSWYASNEAKLVAENVLLSQKDMGGWEKNKPYHQPIPDSLKVYYLKAKSEKGGTFDNGSTITELKFLAKIYAQVKEERYRKAFEKGLHYILMAQYDNGGWPQYYPVKDPQDEILLDKTAPYSGHITYNDNAMVNTMLLLKDIYSGNKTYAHLQVSKAIRAKAKNAFDKGIACILKTQIVMDGKPTVWCAQHDEKNLAPANARAYELASFSGSESVAITLLLMQMEHPSQKIIAAVNGAVQWFEKNKIEGIKLERETGPDGKRNLVVVEDKNAPVIWGRFYDLQTSQPFFCSRDGIKRASIAEISHERRNGYGWYTYGPQEVLEKYAAWSKKWKAQGAVSEL